MQNLATWRSTQGCFDWYKSVLRGIDVPGEICGRALYSLLLFSRFLIGCQCRARALIGWTDMQTQARGAGWLEGRLYTEFESLRRLVGGKLAG